MKKLKDNHSSRSFQVEKLYFSMSTALN